MNVLLPATDSQRIRDLGGCDAGDLKEIVILDLSVIRQIKPLHLEVGILRRLIAFSPALIAQNLGLASHHQPLM
jgi:hypothetical protein